jgi:hypothetical protein
MTAGKEYGGNGSVVAMPPAAAKAKPPTAKLPVRDDELGNELGETPDYDDELPL